MTTLKCPRCGREFNQTSVPNKLCLPCRFKEQMEKFSPTKKEGE